MPAGSLIFSVCDPVAKAASLRAGRYDGGGGMDRREPLSVSEAMGTAMRGTVTASATAAAGPAIAKRPKDTRRR